MKNSSVAIGILLFLSGTLSACFWFYVLPCFFIAPSDRPEPTAVDTMSAPVVNISLPLFDKNVQQVGGKAESRALPLPDIVPGRTFTNSVGMVMVWVAPGVFDMGYIPSRNYDVPTRTVPVHRVVFKKGFWMSAHEVTQEQFRAVMHANPSRFSGDRLPVERVTWGSARAFCDTLSEREARFRYLKTPEEMGFRYSLPSEAQWEYVCRAGLACSEIDASLPDYAWFRLNSKGKTHPVGLKKANRWGVYDMLGNVEEWCLDKAHPDYNGAPVDGSAWLESGSFNRIVRGASWDTVNAGRCKPFFRMPACPAGKEATRGFRCVLLQFDTP